MFKIVVFKPIKSLPSAFMKIAREKKLSTTLKKKKAKADVTFFKL